MDDNNQSYTFKWFEGPQFPETVSEILLQDESDNENDEIDIELSEVESEAEECDAISDNDE